MRNFWRFILDAAQPVRRFGWIGRATRFVLPPALGVGTVLGVVLAEPWVVVAVLVVVIVILVMAGAKLEHQLRDDFGVEISLETAGNAIHLIVHNKCAEDAVFEARAFVVECVPSLPRASWFVPWFDSPEHRANIAPQGWHRLDLGYGELTHHEGCHRGNVSFRMIQHLGDMSANIEETDAVFAERRPVVVAVDVQRIAPPGRSTHQYEIHLNYEPGCDTAQPTVVESELKSLPKGFRERNKWDP